MIGFKVSSSAGFISFNGFEEVDLSFAVEDAIGLKVV